MRTGRIETTRRGWFVGDFDNAIFNTPSCEVCYRIMTAEDVPKLHHHKEITETTLIVSGKVKLSVYNLYFDNQEKVLEPKAELIVTDGDIFVIEPYESVSFEVLEEARIVVVKTPSKPGDKYYDVKLDRTEEHSDLDR